MVPTNVQQAKIHTQYFCTADSITITQCESNHGIYPVQMELNFHFYESPFVSFVRLLLGEVATCTPIEI